MKRIFFIFIILAIPIFTKYEKFYDEWDNYTVETACFTGSVYKGKNYYKNEELTVCARGFDNYFSVALIKNYRISENIAEIKFDNDEILTIYNIDTNNSEYSLYLDEIDSFYVIENMKKKNFMYVKIDETVYKISLSGFTKDFNKIKNAKVKLFDTGKNGLRYFLNDLEVNRREVFNLFDETWIHYNAYSENDLFIRIEMLYDMLTTMNNLENTGYTISVRNDEFIRRMVKNHIYENDIEDFFKFYEEKILRE